MAKLAYAAWVNEELMQYPEEDRQEVRAEYWSEHGRIVKYDQYVAEAKRRHKTYDPQPDGYLEYYSHFGHTATLIGGALLSVFTWFLMSIVGGSSRGRFRG